MMLRMRVVIVGSCRVVNEAPVPSAVARTTAKLLANLVPRVLLMSAMLEQHPSEYDIYFTFLGFSICREYICIQSPSASRTWNRTCGSGHLFLCIGV